MVDVSRHFGDVTAVDRVSFTVARGEFFSLLGPSGCGKTTTLRLIAGLERPDADGGTIRINGVAVQDRRPYERPLGMVFQSYALFPHLSVEANVRFGLEQHRVPRDEIPGRVAEALDLVRLAPGQFARRMPLELSGGQRQRVALARALVLKPEILLLDEPLGALDLSLRKTMQLELKRLNRQLGMTFVYVTHDQEEALTMSDRIAVMDNAHVVQCGTPAEIYESPRTAFVARFIGESNLFEGTAAAATNGMRNITGANGEVFRVPDRPGLGTGARVRIAVRPEWHDLWTPGALPVVENGVEGVVSDMVFLGETIHVHVDTPASPEPVRVALRNEGLNKPPPWPRGTPVVVGWLPEDCQVLEDEPA